MGYLQALAWAGEVEAGNVSLEDAVRAHLTGNCCPPMGEFTSAAVRAIDKVRSGEGWKWVLLPNGIRAARDNSRLMTADQLVDALNLDAFCESLEEF
jgi:hypothetical protein